MRVTLAGLGCGGPGTMTEEVREALARADYLVGAKRLLEDLPEGLTARRDAAVRPEEITALLAAAEAREACVLLSGDTGFHSGARRLLPLLEARGMEVRVLPGVSSVQCLAARLGRPWQDWVLRSAHGTDCDAAEAVCGGRPVCFLTGGTLGPGALCRRLTEAGLGNLAVTVGENLSYPEERLETGTAASLAGRDFAPLSVLLAEAAPRLPRRTPGIPDGEFLRGGVPMTKQEVRAVLLGKLAVGPEDVCWDVGAGTGSVSVELAMQARAVWAVEREPEALDLIRANRERFCAWNLRIAEGRAPEALAGLPRPDKVFVGGSGRALAEILAAVREAGPAARVCVSAVALETVHAAMEALTALGYETEIAQISVSRARPAGKLHLLAAQNPVFLITGVRP
ncbi:precorrin-6y C5,15-methyltransferase (decarboxylating) subunit CbiE [Oscillospiraceae bacterium 38-13]